MHQSSFRFKCILCDRRELYLYSSLPELFFHLFCHFIVEKEKPPPADNLPQRQITVNCNAEASQHRMRCPGEFSGKISSITSDTIHNNNTQGSISQLIAPERRYPLNFLIKPSMLPPPYILITTLIHNILKNFNKM